MITGARAGKLSMHAAKDSSYYSEGEDAAKVQAREIYRAHGLMRQRRAPSSQSPCWPDKLETCELLSNRHGA